jgi:hypothetical protein
MIKILKQKIASTILIASLFLVSTNLVAEEKKHRYFYKPDSQWDVFIYGGRYSETDLLPILLRGKTDYRKSDILVIGASKPLDYRFRFFDFEVEANVGKHFGIMRHWEANGLYIARVNNLFSLPLSFAIGEGLSLASSNPKLENKPKGLDLENFTIQVNSRESSVLLNYLMVELEAGEKDSDWPRVFFRIHHRSGIFGLYCKPDPACGSNFVTYGIRFPLNRILPD